MKSSPFESFSTKLTSRLQNNSAAQQGKARRAAEQRATSTHEAHLDANLNSHPDSSEMGDLGTGVKPNLKTDISIINNASN